jgi:putative aldouronate transport system permease protein
MTVLSKPNQLHPRKNHINEGSKLATAMMYLLGAIVVFITLYPMYYVLILSLSDPVWAMSMRVYTLPKGFSLHAYKVLMADSNFWLAYRNTILYVIPNTVLPIVTSIMVAYPLTFPNLWGKKALTWYLLVPMYFGGGLIAEFLLMLKLGLYDTPWVMIIPGCYSIWYIILFRSFFRTVPDELREAARIDGANVYQILFYVYLPNSITIIAVIAIYCVVGTWNSWYNAFVFLPQKEWQPLQLYLRRVLTLANNTGVEEMSAQAAEEARQLALSLSQIKYSMIIVSTVPILAVYPFFQRYFSKGVMLGSLKD